VQSGIGWLCFLCAAATRRQMSIQLTWFVNYYPKIHCSDGLNKLGLRPKAGPNGVLI
jgi:hypothetical protein